MKKTLFIFLFAAAFQMNAQTTIFEDSFETYEDFIIENIGEWTVIDIDLLDTYGFQGVPFENSGAPKSFQIFNTNATDPVLAPTEASDWTARTGMKAAICFAAVPNAPIVANNDWLITPQITLNTENNTLSFWAKSCDTAFGNEKFRVGVSTDGTATTDFTIISAGNFITNPATAVWIEYTYNLDNYAGQSIYIAINCVSDDQFGFAIDDFKVTSGTLSSDNFFAENLKIYPNPAENTVTLNSHTSLIERVTLTDLNGRVVLSKNINALQDIQLNISNLNTGLYFISVQTDKGIGTSKIVKK
jgi:hypothetical protein